MKPVTLARLEILAASREAQLRAAIQRHHAAIERGEEQCGVLDSYRARLAAGWQRGNIVSAAQARRAGKFAAAGEDARAQIGQAAQQAEAQREAAAGDLAKLQSHRRALASMRQQEAAAAAREAEQQRERDIQWRTGRAASPNFGT
jgi:flagellar biosynthesis chaperone FliJ